MLLCPTNASVWRLTNRSSFLENYWILSAEELFARSKIFLQISLFSVNAVKKWNRAMASVRRSEYGNSNYRCKFCRKQRWTCPHWLQHGVVLAACKHRILEKLAEEVHEDDWRFSKWTWTPTQIHQVNLNHVIPTLIFKKRWASGEASCRCSYQRTIKSYCSRLSLKRERGWDKTDSYKKVMNKTSFLVIRILLCSPSHLIINLKGLIIKIFKIEIFCPKLFFQDWKSTFDENSFSSVATFC